MPDGVGWRDEFSGEAVPRPSGPTIADHLAEGRRLDAERREGTNAWNERRAAERLAHWNALIAAAQAELGPELVMTCRQVGPPVSFRDNAIDWLLELWPFGAGKMECRFRLLKGADEADARWKLAPLQIGSLARYRVYQNYHATDGEGVRPRDHADVATVGEAVYLCQLQTTGWNAAFADDQDQKARRQADADAAENKSADTEGP